MTALSKPLGAASVAARVASSAFAQGTFGTASGTSSEAPTTGVQAQTA